MRSIHLTFLVITCLWTLVSCRDESQIDKANRDGFFIMGNSDEPKGLDPHLVSGVIEGNIIRAIFEGLCVDHPSKNAECLPGVAKSWQPNEDFTEWTFNLRTNALWSDKVPITAEDFVFSYRRILSPNLGAKYSEMLYYLANAKEYNQNHKGYIFFKANPNSQLHWDLIKEANFTGNEKVDIASFRDIAKDDPSLLNKDQKKDYYKYLGLNKLSLAQLQEIRDDEFLFDWPESVNMDQREIIINRLIKHAEAGSPDLWDLANVGVTAVTPQTLRLNLRGPIPFLPEITKHYTWFPVPRHVILKHGTIDTPNTGWTRVNNIVSNGPFTLSSWRFNHHIEVTKSPTYWDKETVKLNGVRYLPIKNSYTETRMFYDNQIHKTYSLAPEMILHTKKVRPAALRQEPYVGVYFLRLNSQRESLSKIKVRLALSAAIDRQLIIDNLLQGGQTPAHGIVPQTEEYSTKKMLHFNVDEAKKLMAEAGYPDGKGFSNDLKILTTHKETSVRMAEALQAMWKQHLGINVRIEQREWGTFLTAQQELDYDIAVGGWIGDFLDPTTFLDMWTKGNGNNNTGWSSVSFEKQLNLAEKNADPTQRLEILKKAEATILQERPIIPIYWYTTNYLLHSSVRGWHPLLLDNHPFKFINLQPN